VTNTRPKPRALICLASSPAGGHVMRNTSVDQVSPALWWRWCVRRGYTRLATQGVLVLRDLSWHASSRSQNGLLSNAETAEALDWMFPWRPRPVGGEFPIVSGKGARTN
jgi:hypothetical protein